MKNLITKIKPLICIFVTIVFIAGFNLPTVKAAEVRQINKVTTILNYASTNNSITVSGNTNDLYSGTNYTVSTLEDFKSKLETAISNGDDSITINYDGTKAIAGFPATISNTIITQIMQTAGNDYEKLLLHVWTTSYSTPVNNTFTATYKFTYWETPDQRTQVTSEVNSILAKIITAGMTDEQKEKVINDYLCSKIAYDTTLVHHSAYDGLFGNKKTVCQGYALLAYKMLTTAGLDARIVLGTANGDKHAWNKVKLKSSDGTSAWYDLDVTWNDPVPDVIGRVRYDYFNLTDSQLMQKAHKWDASYYPAANTPYITTDKDIINGGRKADVVSPAPSSSNITVKNNYNIADVITINNLTAGDIVRVYKDATSTTPLKAVTVPAAKTSVTISVPQLGASAGSIYVTVQNINAFESARTTSVNYAAEPQTAKLDPKSITPANNVDTVDTVTVTGVAARDVVKVYNADGTKLLGSATAAKAGSVKVSIPKINAFDKAGGTIQVSIKNFDKTESDKVSVNYSAKDQTAKLDSKSITPANNVDTLDTITVTGLSARDIVKVYNADGTKLLASATALKAGSLKISIPKVNAFNKAGGTIQVSVKSLNKLESDKVTVNYSAKDQTTKLDAKSITPINNVDTLDTVTITGLSARDIVKIYNADGTKLLASATALKAGSLKISIPKIKAFDKAGGTIQVSVKSLNKLESDKVTVNYSAKDQTTKLDAKSITPVNNVDTLDYVTVTGLAARDLVKIYSADGTKLLASATALKAGSIKISIPKVNAFDKAGGTIQVSIKSLNKLESDKVTVNYSAKDQTTAINQSDVLLANGAVFVVGLSQGDRISVYTSDAANARPIAVGTVLKGNTYAVVRFAIQPTGTSLYITKKSPNKLPTAPKKF